MIPVFFGNNTIFLEIRFFVEKKNRLFIEFQFEIS